MRKNSIIFTTLSLIVAALFINSPAYAGDIEWSGLYRIEGYRIENSELRSGGQDALGYGLSHLIMRPKITAGDGITIYGQFDIFNDVTDYPNSQMGQIFGDGVRNGNTTAPGKTTSAANSNTLSQTQNAESLLVTQLYLTYNQEYGQLIVGRAPLQFGLGMTYSAGRGLFDHWMDTRDMVGYKIIMGNLSIVPMYGRPSGGTINNSDNINDYMIQLMYENPESDLEMGVMYVLRTGGDQASDAPVYSAGPPVTNPYGLGGQGATQTSGMNIKTVSLYALRDSEHLRLGMEASFQSGDSGVVDTAGDKVGFSGFGIATELEYRPEGSKWKWGLKSGYASGDDPGTNATYEGFQFNRNYDVAMLLFNHPLGQADFLRSGVTTGNVYQLDANGKSTGNINVADVEAISNVIYLAPNIRYVFNDHWSIDQSIITGWLATNPILNVSVPKDLGYEYDVSLTYSPRKGVAWVNQFGMLFPGQAWTAATNPDGSQASNGFAFGFGTKAAISF